MKFIAVTNRSLCLDDKDFFTRIESLCDVLRKGDKILLREPKLEVPEYTTLAEECRDICHDTPIHLLLHTHFETAKANAPKASAFAHGAASGRHSYRLPLFGFCP